MPVFTYPQKSFSWCVILRDYLLSFQGSGYPVFKRLKRLLVKCARNAAKVVLACMYWGSEGTKVTLSPGLPFVFLGGTAWNRVYPVRHQLVFLMCQSLYSCFGFFSFGGGGGKEERGKESCALAVLNWPNCLCNFTCRVSNVILNLANDHIIKM